MATYLNNRQYPKYTSARITAAENEARQILLPPGAIVIGGPGLVIVDAFAGSLPTITIQDNSTVPVGYIEAEALGALAVHPLETDTMGKYYPAGATLTITFGGTVTAGSGEAFFCVGYLLKDAENELYGRG